MSEILQQERPGNATSVSTVYTAEIKKLSTDLQGVIPQLQDSNRGLTKSIALIHEAMQKEGAADNNDLRNHLAYAVQDTERQLGKGNVPMSDGLRKEMTERALTIPGLQDEQMKTLLKSTDTLEDRGLVLDIRKTAYAIAAEGGVGSGAQAADTRIEDLQRRVAPAAQPSAPPGSKVDSASPQVEVVERRKPTFSVTRAPASEQSSVSKSSSPDPNPERQASPPSQSPQGEVAPKEPELSGKAPAQPDVKASAPKTDAKEVSNTSRQASPNGANTKPKKKAPAQIDVQAPNPLPADSKSGNRSETSIQGRIDNEPSAAQGTGPISGSRSDQAHTTPSPGDRPVPQEAPPTRVQAEVSTTQGFVAAVESSGATSRATLGKSAIRRIAEAAGPATKSASHFPYVPFGGRIASQKVVGEDRQADRLMAQAETAGRNAAEAVETFTAGIGRSFMNKVEAAAQKEPGGAAAVLQEMRQGGRHAELRQEFDKQLKTDASFARAYNGATNAVGDYGKARVAVNDRLKAKGLSTTLADERLQSTDAALGEDASRIPGRAQGKSVLEELAEKASAMLQKAVDKVASVFRRPEEPVVQQAARAAPSMSMG